MKISLVIPVYNVEKYVEKCLRSCLDQDISYEEYEIIIINDGTKDNSLEIVERIAKDYSNVSIISQKNAGLSAARNKGLSLAKGEYVWFIDSDDWIKSQSLRKITDFCIENSLDALSISAANVIGDSIERRSNYKSNDIFNGKDVLKMGVINVSAPFTIYKRDYLIENKLFFTEGIFHEDSEFTPRAYYYLNKISFLDDICYFVRQNPTSITRTPNSKKAFDCIIVAKCLSDFSENINQDLKIQFDNFISLIINNSLHNTYEMSKKNRKELNQFIFKYKFLFKHLLKSSRLKYKMEGILFYIWPKKTIQVYQIIQKLNLKSIQKNHIYINKTF